jgi:DNA-binding CsgD family transcriptional regulator
MGKRGPKPGTIHRAPGPMNRRCVLLFDAGHRPAAIARKLGLSPAGVSSHLRRAGRVSADRLAAARASARERFIVAWQAAPDILTLAKRLKTRPNLLKMKAARLRQAGVRLKRFPSRRWPHTRGAPAAILRLKRRGVRTSVIALRLGVTPQYVCSVVRQDRARKAGR